MSNNGPKIIWLQVDEFPEITWCADKIHDTDVEYIRHTQRKDITAERIKEIMNNKLHIGIEIIDAKRLAEELKNDS